MIRKTIAALVAAGLFAGTAQAGKEFQPYEGRDAIQEGTGGTRVTTDGIDFWTMGSPPRRYQILGALLDKRGTGVFHGKAVGAHSIAKKVRALGGSALIVLGQDREVTGMVSTGYGGFVAARRATTQMLVVKYIAE